MTYLWSKGFEGDARDYNGISKFVRKRLYAAEPVSFQPKKGKSRPVWGMFDEQLDVIDGINGKPLPEQTIHRVNSKKGVRRLDVVKNSREFELHFSGPDDPQWGHVWNQVIVPFLQRWKGNTDV